MLNKIFLILFAVAILFMATLSFLTNSQLSSIGFPPPQIVDTFKSYENLHWLSLWISSLILLVLSNVIMWTYRKSWALWLTFSFFAVFIMVNTWWLTESLKAYQIKEHLDTAGLLSKNGIFGAIFCIVGGVGIFFNQYIVLRLRDKMFNKPDESVEQIEPEKAEEIAESEQVEEIAEPEKVEETETEETVSEEAKSE